MTAARFTSVWTADDNAFLRSAVPFYLRSSHAPIRVLDATWGLGVFWKKGVPAGWRLAGMDVDPEKRADVRAENRAMPFRSEMLDVVVYDPPHVTHGWSEWSSGGRYGVAQGGGSVGYLFPDFLAEAARVLRRGGIVLCKIAGQVHSGRFFAQEVELANAIQATPGLVLCDIVVKVRPLPRPQPPGRQRLHAERRHSYWIVARKGRC